MQCSISYHARHRGREPDALAGAGNIKGTGNAADNVIIGNEGDNVLTGKAGRRHADRQWRGRTSSRLPTGDSGAALGSRDLITDFTLGTDKLDLSAIDANSGGAGDKAFRFLGTAPSTARAAALRYSYDADRNVTVLEGDINGDRAADFAIDLTGNKALTDSRLHGRQPAGAAQLTGDGRRQHAGGRRAQRHAVGPWRQRHAARSCRQRPAGRRDWRRHDGGRRGRRHLCGGRCRRRGDGGGQASAFTAPAGWTLKGTADFNADGQIDVVVTNGRRNQIWLLQERRGGIDGDRLQFWRRLDVAGIADLNGDGNRTSSISRTAARPSEIDYL